MAELLCETINRQISRKACKMSELPPRRKKKRRPARSSKRPADRKQEASAVEQESRTSAADRLGKLLEKHEVTLGAVLVVFAVLCVIGGEWPDGGYFRNK